MELRLEHLCPSAMHMIDMQSERDQDMVWVREKAQKKKHLRGCRGRGRGGSMQGEEEEHKLCSLEMSEN